MVKLLLLLLVVGVNIIVCGFPPVPPPVPGPTAQVPSEVDEGFYEICSIEGCSPKPEGGFSKEFVRDTLTSLLFSRSSGLLRGTIVVVVVVVGACF